MSHSLPHYTSPNNNVSFQFFCLPYAKKCLNLPFSYTYLYTYACLSFLVFLFAIEQERSQFQPLQLRKGLQTWFLSPFFHPPDAERCQVLYIHETQTDPLSGPFVCQRPVNVPLPAFPVTDERTACGALLGLDAGAFRWIAMEWVSENLTE